LLSTADVAELAADPLFEIGGHGSTHTMLSALSPTEQRQEIDGSRTRLEAATGNAPTSFAYPYGTPESFDEATITLVQAAGYERACRNTGGSARADRERYSLARHMVYDWTGAELAQRVRAWFDAA
jgi:peptidoglycan/xylan/chitin deacetylase (PgdA/CDA1 family)